jgi:hypothetical protein
MASLGATHYPTNGLAFEVIKGVYRQWASCRACPCNCIEHDEGATSICGLTTIRVEIEASHYRGLVMKCGGLLLAFIETIKNYSPLYVG